MAELEQDSIIKFIRNRDYILKRELGQGACGKTVLLFDDVINEYFVCKKYSPSYEDHQKELFKRFLQEIKILHLVHHRNIVRVFNYYVYPEQVSGYLLMEFVDGKHFQDHLANHPEKVDDIFRQSIAGFSYLEDKRILHRDIRPSNLMVDSTGIVKIIDFGFGKTNSTVKDIDKSISLNWWCETPEEFGSDRYDFQTEVYFLGKLFERAIKDCKIETFSYQALLRQMCSFERRKRISSFNEIRRAIISQGQNSTHGFGDVELSAYREFSASLVACISKIETNCTYVTDATAIEASLDSLYMRVMLEEYIPSSILFGATMKSRLRMTSRFRTSKEP